MASPSFKTSGPTTQNHLTVSTTMRQALTLPELTSKSHSLRKMKKQKQGLGATDILRLKDSSSYLAGFLFQDPGRGTQGWIAGSYHGNYYIVSFFRQSLTKVNTCSSQLSKTKRKTTNLEDPFSPTNISIYWVPGVQRYANNKTINTQRAPSLCLYVYELF